MLPDEFHTNIRLAREQADLTQQEMAEELGVGRTTYIAFEVGRTQLFHPLLPKVAGRLGLSVEQLLLGRDVNVLRDQATLDEWKHSVVEDYERRIAALQERLDAADKVISLQDANIRTLTESNRYLLEQLRKDG